MEMSEDQFQTVIPTIDEAALDRAVRIVMPDILTAMRNGSCRTYRFALEAYLPCVVVEYHRQREAA